MYKTTVGKLLLKHYSPDSTHAFLDSKDLDKKNIGTFFADLADKHPDKYEKVVSNLTRLGFESATRLGSTVRLTDLLPPNFKQEKMAQLYKDIDAIKAKHLTKSKEDDELNDLLSKFNNEIDSLLVSEGVRDNKTLAKIIKAGARGSPTQYRQTIFGPISVSNNQGGVLTDFIIDKSFAEGLTLPQYLAHTFGARQASAAGKLSVAEGGFLCFAGETGVRMGDLSVKQIKDIIPGDMVLGSDMLGNTFPVKVNKLFCNGTQPTEVFKFRKGKSRNDFIEVTATSSHYILGSVKLGKDKQFCGKIPLAVFKDGYSGKSTIGFKSKTTKRVEYYKGLLIGLLLGDGSIANHHITLASADTLLIDNLNELLKSKNLVLNKINRKKLSYEYLLSEIVPSKIQRNKLGQAISKRRHPVWKLLDELKLSGTTSHTKFIPNEVFNWCDAAVFGVIAGLIETDGCITRTNNASTPIISYYSASKQLAEGLQQLLSLRAGIHTSVRKVKMGKPHYSESLKLQINPTGPGYTLVISNPLHIQRFKDLIRLPGIKESRLASYIQQGKIYDGYNHEYSYSFVSKEKADAVTVYDISVDHPDHLYVLANGLIVSNSKQLARAGMTTIVTEHDCGTHKGIEIAVSDKEYIGSFLAVGVDKYHHNNEVTPSMLADLANKKITFIVVRNPITCEASKHSHENSVCQLCAGKRDLGLPAIHSYLGVAAGSSAAEPLAQGALNSKHSGGSAKGRTAFGGVKYINQLFNIPETFVHEAPVAHSEGTVTDVKVAAQGGHYVVITKDDGKLEEHYVHPDLLVTAVKGQKVEPGDVLSQGIPNPAKIVKLKGLGEGRVYFAKAIKDTFDTSGLGGINKRNFDIISKGLISHVKITDNKGIGDYLPESVVNYHSLEKDYVPRVDSKKVRSDQAKGMYLEIPVLHYTIGTRISSGITENLKKHNIEYVTVNAEPPGFEPEMQRLLDVPAHNQDWMHVLYSTNLERRLIKAVNTGASSNIKGPSPVPGLAYALGFADKKAEDEEPLSFE